MDCRKRKRNSASALAFEARLERNLCSLYEELISGAYVPGRSICFVVTRPKTEARECVASMLEWQREQGRTSIGIGQAALAGVMELVRAANFGVQNAPNVKTTDDILRLYLSKTEFEPA
jgi:hypothetical protein